ncbi:MAG: hypothetical protein HZC42_06865 [Candidatus Eisenbacteria bacterium]|nr:hypothetical protein [Candidatus Eisenbacteria bacterium]
MSGTINEQVSTAPYTTVELAEFAVRNLQGAVILESGGISGKSALTRAEISQAASLLLLNAQLELLSRRLEQYCELMADSLAALAAQRAGH